MASTLLLSLTNQSNDISQCVNIFPVNFTTWSIWLDTNVFKFRLSHFSVIWLGEEAINRAPDFSLRAVCIHFCRESLRLGIELFISSVITFFCLFVLFLFLAFVLNLLLYSVNAFLYCFYFCKHTRMELNSLLLLLEAAEYLERRDRGIYGCLWGQPKQSFYLFNFSFLGSNATFKPASWSSVV